MQGAFHRSWQITKLSWGVIQKDREILLFPLIGGIFSILYIAALLFPTGVFKILSREQEVSTWLQYLILFVIYLGLSLIATFFNVCVVYTTKVRFSGGNATFSESLGFALKRFHLICLWALLSATVGIILRLIDELAERLGFVGQIIVNIITALVGGVWSIISVFVVPGMVYHNLGPIAALKQSLEVLRRTWGESLIRYFGLGWIQFCFTFLGVVVFALLFYLLAKLGTPAMIAVGGVAAVYFIGVTLIFYVLNTIFNTALYEYGCSSRIPEGYTQDILAGSFRLKAKKEKP